MNKSIELLNNTADYEELFQIMFLFNKFQLQIVQ